MQEKFCAAKALIGKAGNVFNNILYVLKQNIFPGLLRQK